jgi:hypothetical protein
VVDGPAPPSKQSVKQKFEWPPGKPFLDFAELMGKFHVLTLKKKAVIIGATGCGFLKVDEFGCKPPWP